VEKEYEAVVDKTFDFTLKEKLLHGISTSEGFARAESVHKLANNKIKLVLKQGLKRQIRLMFHELGYEVIKLVRTRIGPIQLGDMPSGTCRVLTRREIESLLRAGASTEESSERVSRPKKPKSLREIIGPRAPRKKPAAAAESLPSGAAPHGSDSAKSRPRRPTRPTTPKGRDEKPQSKFKFKSKFNFRPSSR